jgi:glucosamine--fructose-6-phosphate aminotransferase (isomerizing)
LFTRLEGPHRENSFMTLHQEIFEQPGVLGQLLSDQMSAVQAIARQIASKDIRYVFLAARGTSDNAGRYANYLWGSLNRLPIALAAPSLFTLYQQPPSLKGALVVGVSQSGQSPDIVSVLAEGQRQGSPTLAITNEPDSPLAQAADFVIDIQAGVERAVAATKTYTAELLAIAMLAVSLKEDAARRRSLDNVPGWVQQMLAQDEHLKQLTQRYRFMQQCVVLGRGYNYSTAFEWSLKLKELAYVGAEPYSSADFQHGPIAIVEHGFPVMAVLPDGPVFENMLALLRRLRRDQAAELLVISDRSEALSLAQSAIALPSDVPEWLTPIVSIVPAQLFTYHLTVAKDFDPETPRIIHKVTETK